MKKSPVLFLAHGHSGTRAIAKVLAMSGIYMGKINDGKSLNPQYDSLIWSNHFQAPLVHKYFQFGKGIVLDSCAKTEVKKLADECKSMHLPSGYNAEWGFKICMGAFAFQLYETAFCRPKYISVVRDGRDVILGSNNGHFYLTGNHEPALGTYFYDFYNKLTFGISNDENEAPFETIQDPSIFEKFLHLLNQNGIRSKKIDVRREKRKNMMEHRFWIQAKTWKEHCRMLDKLREEKILEPARVFEIRYEELCTNPFFVLENLFEFLEMPFSSEMRAKTGSLFHTKSIGKYRNFQDYVSDSKENFEEIFGFMTPELIKLGYS